MVSGQSEPRLCGRKGSSLEPFTFPSFRWASYLFLCLIKKRKVEQSPRLRVLGNVEKTSRIDSAFHL